jgi:hypothetical protein
MKLKLHDAVNNKQVDVNSTDDDGTSLIYEAYIPIYYGPLCKSCKRSTI